MVTLFVMPYFLKLEGYKNISPLNVDIKDSSPFMAGQQSNKNPSRAF
jgi:hypothetical protein